MGLLLLLLLLLLRPWHLGWQLLPLLLLHQTSC
jgi:hypothetical protein